MPEQELLSNLSILKDSELLYERGIYPDSTYIFKHAPTREVVYDSILTKKKKQIHEKDRHYHRRHLQRRYLYHYGVLSNHCLAGENYEKGAEVCKAGSKETPEGCFL